MEGMYMISSVSGSLENNSGIGPAGLAALRLLQLPVKPDDSVSIYKTYAKPYLEIRAGEVIVIIWSDYRNSSYFGDSDNWYREEACIFWERDFDSLLNKLKPGSDVFGWVKGKAVLQDSAWGWDCEDPHDSEISREVEIGMVVHISHDLTEARLELKFTDQDGSARNVIIERKDAG